MFGLKKKNICREKERTHGSPVHVGLVPNNNAFCFFFWYSRRQEQQANHHYAYDHDIHCRWWRTEVSLMFSFCIAYIRLYFYSILIEFLVDCCFYQFVVDCTYKEVERNSEVSNTRPLKITVTYCVRLMMSNRLGQDLILQTLATSHFTLFYRPSSYLEKQIQNYNIKNYPTRCNTKQSIYYSAS